MKTLVIVGAILGVLSLASRSPHSEGILLGLMMFGGLGACIVIAAKSHRNHY